MFSGKEVSSQYSEFSNTVADFLENILVKDSLFQLKQPETNMFYSFDKMYYVTNKLWDDFDIAKHDKYQKAIIEYMKKAIGGKNTRSTRDYEHSLSSFIGKGLFSSLEAYKRCAPILLGMERKAPLDVSAIPNGRAEGEVFMIIGKIIKSVEAASILEHEVCDSEGMTLQTIKEKPNTLVIGGVGEVGNGERYYYNNMGCQIKHGNTTIILFWGDERLVVDIEDDGKHFLYDCPEGFQLSNGKRMSTRDMIYRSELKDRDPKLYSLAESSAKVFNSNSFYRSVIIVLVRSILESMANSFESLREPKKIFRYYASLKESNEKMRLLSSAEKKRTQEEAAEQSKAQADNKEMERLKRDIDGI